MFHIGLYYTKKRRESITALTLEWFINMVEKSKKSLLYIDIGSTKENGEWIVDRNSSEKILILFLDFSRNTSN